MGRWGRWKGEWDTGEVDEGDGDEADDDEVDHRDGDEVEEWDSYGVDERQCEETAERDDDAVDTWKSGVVDKMDVSVKNVALMKSVKVVVAAPVRVQYTIASKNIVYSYLCVHTSPLLICRWQ